MRIRADGPAELAHRVIADYLSEVTSTKHQLNESILTIRGTYFVSSAYPPAAQTELTPVHAPCGIESAV